MAKQSVDWEAIEREYRAGVRTLRDIASEHGVSHVGIDKRAKKFGWSRDLSAKVRAKTDELVNKAAVNKPVTNEDLLTEREIILTNAQMQADIVLTHRKHIGKYRNLCGKMFAELEAQTDLLPDLENLGELCAAPNENGYDKLHELYKKIIATPSRADTLKKLTDSFKTLVGLEREAFNLSDNANGDANQQHDELATIMRAALGTALRPGADA